MKPIYSLVEIKLLASQPGKVAMTNRAAREAGQEFDFMIEEVCDVILSLKEFDFHSTGISRLTHEAFDVYTKKLYAQPYRKHMNAYIKLTIDQNGLIIISFHTTL